jgi:hypothetical protein
VPRGDVGLDDGPLDGRVHGPRSGGLVDAHRRDDGDAERLPRGDIGRCDGELDACVSGPVQRRLVVPRGEHERGAVALRPGQLLPRGQRLADALPGGNVGLDDDALDSDV